MNLCHGREVFFVLKRYAGHSKWQNIRHTKALKDSQKSIIFTRICQRIKIAIQENGNNSNPISNHQLSQLIEFAKSNNMPVSSIQSCIKSTQVEKEGKACRYSIRGPRGSFLLVTALTNSQVRTKQELCFYLKKVGGIMSDQSLEGSFEKRGVIVAFPPTGIENSEEAFVDHAIEAGAEEVSPLVEDRLTFYSELSELHKVKSKLEELKYTIEEAKITLVPKMKVTLDDSEIELMNKIISKIEEHPAVVEIHDNIE